MKRKRIGEKKHKIYGQAAAVCPLILKEYKKKKKLSSYLGAFGSETTTKRFGWKEQLIFCFPD
jgi:hypothetical protein